MNYRHGYHAGNFADVVKHLALVAILLHLRKKDTAFAVVDSHAGRGAYDLTGAEAGKTGEAQRRYRAAGGLVRRNARSAVDLSVAGEGKMRPIPVRR